MSNSKKWSVKKSDKVDEKKALSIAMKKLETFETNLTPDHTETHYVFKRIR